MCCYVLITWTNVDQGSTTPYGVTRGNELSFSKVLYIWAQWRLGESIDKCYVLSSMLAPKYIAYHIYLLYSKLMLLHMMFCIYLYLFLSVSVLSWKNRKGNIPVDWLVDLIGFNAALSHNTQHLMSLGKWRNPDHPLKSRIIPIVYNSWRIVPKFCTWHGKNTAVLCICKIA